MSRCVIISACPVSPELAEALRPDDFIIACDAGYRNCAPLGRRPNIIVGDFDTAPCPEAVDTADGSWKRTVSSKGAGSVTALCPVESRLYLGLAGSEKVRSANL